MNRTLTMTPLYLASAIGTLMLIGCTVNTGEDTSQQAGKSGIAGARSLPGGFAGASAAAGTGGAPGQSGAGTSSAGLSAGGVSAGGVSAGGVSAGGVSAGGASAGRASYGGTAGELPLPGFSWGGSNSFGFAGFANVAGTGSVFRIDPNAGAGGTGNIRLPSAFAGTTFWISD